MIPFFKKRIRGRRAVVDMLVDFVIAFVLLMVVFIVLKVALAFGVAKAGIEGTATITPVSESSTCDYWLMNFLRAKSNSGIVFSDMLTRAKSNAEQKNMFETGAADYFEKNYKRAYHLERWQLRAETATMTPILSIGYQDKRLARSCSQKVVSKEGPIKVTLGVDY